MQNAHIGLVKASEMDLKYNSKPKLPQKRSLPCEQRVDCARVRYLVVMVQGWGMDYVYGGP